MSDNLLRAGSFYNPIPVDKLPPTGDGSYGAYYKLGDKLYYRNPEGLYTEFVGEQEKTDLVNHPPHYTKGSIECIDAMEAMLGRDGMIAYLRGTIMKYNWRLLHKENPAQDRAKMEWYTARLKKLMEEEK